MTLAVRAVFSLMAYLGVVIAPLAFAAMGGSRPALGFWVNFSVALGFVGLAMMGLEFAAFRGLLGWVRLVKPRVTSRRPWRLERVAAERGQTTTLALSPPEGLDFRFEPGQFAWSALGRSPFSLTMHPFSFSSSAERKDVEIAVKALGDFTSTIHELSLGTSVYVDGPHGVFSMDRDEGPGFGFIAGGVGITGLISMLRTMTDRGDARPAILVYANGEWEGVTFREEVERLQSKLNLTVVHVLTRPPAGWADEPATSGRSCSRATSRPATAAFSSSSAAHRR